MGGYVWKSKVVNPCEKARHHRIIGKHPNVHIDGGHQHIQLRIPSSVKDIQKCFMSCLMVTHCYYFQARSYQTVKP